MNELHQEEVELAINGVKRRFIVGRVEIRTPYEDAAFATLESYSGEYEVTVPLEMLDEVRE